MENKLDIIIIGGIGVDTNIFIPGREIDFSVESNYTENFDYVGQAGGYASRGFAQMGYKTGLIDFIGQDYHGEYIKRELDKDGIYSLLLIDPLGTRRSINIMYKDGRRKNFYDGKSHMTLSMDLKQGKNFLKKSELIHFNLMNWSRELISIAKELNMTISCDLQDIIDPDDTYRQDFIKNSDVLFFSTVNYDDPKPLIKRLQKKNTKAVFIGGMGEMGCVLASGTKIQFFPPVEMKNKPIIDTNGAGDGLVVGFLSSFFLDGYSMEDSINRGQLVARYTCSIKASTSNLITRQELDELFVSSNLGFRS